MKSTFQVGDMVRRKAFTDAFGKHWPESLVLVVEDVLRIEASPLSAHPITPYYRVLAYGAGFSTYEGAERFFRRSEME
jgi:hypothetical protein